MLLDPVFAWVWNIKSSVPVILLVIARDSVVSK